LKHGLSLSGERSTTIRCCIHVAFCIIYSARS
jgi:hypothetical protein